MVVISDYVKWQKEINEDFEKSSMQWFPQDFLSSPPILIIVKDHYDDHGVSCGDISDNIGGDFEDANGTQC